MTSLSSQHSASETSAVKIEVRIRAAQKPGAIKAHADISITFATTSTLEIFGISVVQQDESKPPWISYPQRAGKKAGRFFPIVRIIGALHDWIVREVLTEYARSLARASAAESKNGVREPGQDDSIPF